MIKIFSNDEIKEMLENLSEDEQERVKSIIDEIEKDGMSKTLNDIYAKDYDEIPVDIDTFLESPRYAGWMTNNGKNIYPYWRERLRELFDPTKSYQEVAFSGCLTGDTKIPLLDGTEKTIKELSEMSSLKDVYCYSFDIKSNEYTVGDIIDAFSTGVKDVYRISFDNGTSIKATSNHRFLLRNKKWKSIDTGLKVYDSLMPCIKGRVRCGKSLYESITHNDTLNSTEPIHKMVMRWKIGKSKGTVHHKDWNRLNNNPNNLLITDRIKHWKYHAKNGGMASKEHNEKYRKGLLPKSIIVNIEYVGKEPVYDLTVAEHHNFVTSNGIVAHNSIGIGKSSIAIFGLAYQFYKLMCLKDPHAFYNISKGGYIYIVFFNATLMLSQGVAYTKFQSLLQHSPWFMERGTLTGKKYVEYVPNKPIRFTVGSTIEHSLGKDIYCGLIDEVNFVKGANITVEKSKIMKLYNSVLERMGSRFMVNGKIAGCLFVVSSKKSEHDFIESYLQKKKGDPNLYIVDAPLWEVKPTGTYSGKTFKVAVGGLNMPSKVIKDEDEDFYKKMGYSIINPPLEFKHRFEMDIEAALMNIAGISVSMTTKFITYSNMEKCFINDYNPFKSNILSIGLYDTLKIEDFFNADNVPMSLYTRPVYIHIDTSLTGDRTGISAIAALGYKNIEDYSVENGTNEIKKKLVYRQLFSIGIECPSGSEISFQKTRDFLYTLKHVHNWNIQGISLDGFQSADTKQQLILNGFDTARIISLDRTPDGYLTFKNAINEQRIQLLKDMKELETEIIELERDNMSGKVDHPVNGSKDISDSLCGALYNAFLSESPDNLQLLEVTKNAIAVNDEYAEDDRKQILKNIIKQTVYDIRQRNSIINSQIDNAEKIEDNEGMTREELEEHRKLLAERERELRRVNQHMNMNDGIIMF